MSGYYSQYYAQQQQPEKKSGWSSYIPHMSISLWIVLILFLLLIFISIVTEGCSIFSVPNFIAGLSVDSSTYDY